MKRVAVSTNSASLKGPRVRTRTPMLLEYLLQIVPKRTCASHPELLGCPPEESQSCGGLAVIGVECLDATKPRLAIEDLPNAGAPWDASSRAMSARR